MKAHVMAPLLRKMSAGCQSQLQCLITRGQNQAASPLQQRCRQSTRLLPSRMRHRRVTMCLSASMQSTEELPLADLQAMLADAVRQEDYARAAKLRDELARRSEDDRAGVEDANRRFYEAFRRNDYKAMEDIWGEGEHVQCIHPGAGCIAGRNSVMESWRMILRGRGMSIDLLDVRVFAGEGVGFVTCTEVMEAGDSRGRTAATNVFEKQDNRWVLVHHHGSPAPIFV